MRVLLDGTPLLGLPTGVGRYTRGLLDGLLALPEPPDVRLLAVTSRGPAALRPLTTTPVAGRRVPARLLHALWSRADVPSVEALGGRGADVVHATNFALPPSRRAAGVVSVHDLDFATAGDTRGYDRLLRRAFARGALAVTLTDTVGAAVADRYRLPGDRVRTVRPGVGPQWAAATPSVPDGLPTDFVLFVGTIEPRKGVPVLLDALRLAPPGLPLVLAGRAGRLDTAGLPAGAVVPAGYVDDADLPGLVAAARALVLPSRDEGFGLTALEALAAGTPVLCSDLPVLREVLGDHATYVRAGDAEAWAAALAHLPDPDAGRGERRAHAASWTWQRCAEDALRAYERALSG